MRDYNKKECFAEYKLQIKPYYELSNPIQAIVDKAVEFVTPTHLGTTLSEEIGRNYDPVKFARALEGLQFSKSTVDYVAKSGHQFADDVTTPFIGNYTAASLNMIVQEVGSELDKDTMLSLAFPDKTFPSYKVLLDRIAGNTGIAPEFYGDGSALPTVNPLNTYGLTYEPGLWGMRCMLNAKDIMFARDRGKPNFDDRGIGQLVAYNSVNMVTQIMTRKKKLINDAIWNNGFSYASGGISYNISSNIPSQNYVAMYEPMGVLNANGTVTYATSEPLYTPLIALMNILNNPIFIKYRRYIRGLVCNGADLQAIMNHPNVKAVTNLMVANTMSLSTRKLSVQMGGIVKELNAYYAPSFDFPLLADDGVWQQQNSDGTSKTTPNDATNPDSAQQFFVPRGALYVLLDLTEMGGQNGAFHLTYNEVDPNIEAPAMGLFTGVFNRNLTNSDTTNRLDIVAAFSGAPAVYMPEAQFILTGLYSNVSFSYNAG